MAGRLVVGLMVVVVVALVIVTYAGSVTSSTPQAPASGARPINASRLFMLLPDGKVEITDAWARRLYRWDGHRWVELEVTKVPASPAELR